MCFQEAVRARNIARRAQQANIARPVRRPGDPVSSTLKLSFGFPVFVNEPKIKTTISTLTHNLRRMILAIFFVFYQKRRYILIWFVFKIEELVKKNHFCENVASYNINRDQMRG